MWHCVNAIRVSVNCAAAGPAFISKERSALPCWKAGGVGGDLDMCKPIISEGDIKVGGIPTSRLWFPRCLTNFMMADFSFTPPAQDTKCTEIYTDLHVPERSSL